MSLKFWRSGAYKTVAPTNVVRIRRNNGTTWQIVQRMRIWKTVGNDTGWRDFYIKSGTTPPASPPPAPIPPPPEPVILAVTLTPNPAAGQRQANTAGAVTTPLITAAVAGGVGPYTYAWEPVSWTGSPPPTAMTPTANATQLRQLMSFGTETAQFKCIVTDSLNNHGVGYVDATFTLVERDWDLGDTR